MMLRKSLMIIYLTAVVCWLGCNQFGSNEPPFSFGEGKPGQMVRQTELKNFDPATQQIVYEVHYPVLGLTSLATLGFSMKEMTSEVFADRWTVVYLYNGMMDRALQLPNTIEIYRYDGGGDHRGALINTYTLGSVSTPGKAVYGDQQGRNKTIEMGYFNILPSGS